VSVQKAETCSTLKKDLVLGGRGLDKESFFWYNTLRFGNLKPSSHLIEIAKLPPADRKD
jgi:hypothetical protein